MGDLTEKDDFWGHLNENAIFVAEEARFEKKF